MTTPTNCRWCYGTGLVINNDGRPGWRQPRICYHNSQWRALTNDEKQLHTKRLTQLNENPTPRPTHLDTDNTTSIPGPQRHTQPQTQPRRIDSTRRPKTTPTTPTRLDLDG